MQAFQGCSEIYLEKSPLARILANVYGVSYFISLQIMFRKLLFIIKANTLHWTCLQKLPNMYHSNFWANMQVVLDAIKDGVKVRYT